MTKAPTPAKKPSPRATRAKSNDPLHVNDGDITHDLPPQPRNPISFGFVLWLVVTAIFIAVAIYFVTVAAPRFKSGTAVSGQARTEADVRLTALENTLQGYEQAGGAIALGQVAALSTTLNAVQTAQSAHAPEGIESRIAALEAAVAALKPLADTVPELEARLKQIEMGLQSPVRGPALLLALEQVEQAARRSGPFVAELKAIEVLAPQLSGLGGLRAVAETGVPSQAALIAEFPAIANQAFEMSRQPPADANILDKFVYTLTRFVSVRRTGPATGDSADAILARAEHRLAEGDLRAALDETGRLAGPAAEVVKDWRDGAEARLGLEQVLVALRAEALTVVMSAKPQTATAEAQ